MFDQGLELLPTTCLYLGLSIRGEEGTTLQDPNSSPRYPLLTQHMAHNASGVTRALSLIRRGELSSRQIGFTNGIPGLEMMFDSMLQKDKCGP